MVITGPHIDNSGGVSNACSHNNRIAPEWDNPKRVTRKARIDLKSDMGLEEYPEAMETAAVTNGDPTIMGKWLYPLVVEMPFE